MYSVRGTVVLTSHQLHELIFIHHRQFLRLDVSTGICVFFLLFDDHCRHSIDLPVEPMSKARSITLPFVVWWTPQILAGRRKRTRPLGTTSTGCYKLHVRMGSLLFERCSFFYGTWSRREVLPAIWQHISCRLKIAWTGMLESFLSEQRGYSVPLGTASDGKKPS